MENTTIATELQTTKFIMPKWLTYLINKFAQPIGSEYIFNVNGPNKIFYYKSIKQFSKRFEISNIFRNETEAQLAKSEYEFIEKGKQFDTIKKELDEMKKELESANKQLELRQQVPEKN